MSRRTRRRTKVVPTVLLLVLTFAWAVTLRPTALGGPATFTTVAGTSMEPTYEHGDLVVARASSAYDVGDVIVYAVGEELVIHRIVGGDADGYLTQGDNRARIDPWEPPQGAILGSAWLHVPNVGTWLARTSDPAIRSVMIALLAVVLVGPGAAQLRRRRRRRRGRTSMASTPRRPVATRLPRTSPRPRWVGHAIVAAIVLLVPAIPIAVVGWSQPAEGVAIEGGGTVSQQATFSYTAHAPRSIVYPDGVIGPVTVDTAEMVEPTETLFEVIGEDAEIVDVAQPPMPLYRELIDGLTVGLEYVTMSTDAGIEVEGTARVDAVAMSRDGWTHAVELRPDEPFTGSWQGEVDVPLAAIDTTMRRHAELTGQNTASYALIVRGSFDVHAAASDASVAGSLTSELSFGVGGPTFVPTSGLVTTDRMQLGRQVARPTTVTLGPLEMSTLAARSSGTAVSLLALLVLGLAVAARAGLLSGDPSVRVRMRYGSLLVTIPPGSRVPGRAVPIGTVKELAKLAKAENGVMLHEPFAPRLHRYLVPAGDVVYVHVMAPDDPGKFDPVDLDGIETSLPPSDEHPALFEQEGGPSWSDD